MAKKKTASAATKKKAATPSATKKKSAAKKKTAAPKKPAAAKASKATPASGSATASSFPKELFTFLKGLKKNNRKEWFEEHRADYDAHLKEACLAFIRAFQPKVAAVSKYILAEDRVQGGALFRIYRDTRFSKDKTPYKTHAAMQFRHEASGGDVHAPGIYLHLEDTQSFCGLGLWRPGTPDAKAIREAIVADPAGWKKVAHGKKFRDRFEMHGESLARPPKGFDADHELIDDLKRKDFIAVANYTMAEVIADDFLDRFVADVKLAAPFMAFLTKAVGHEW